jgi:hypothetical protein
MDAAANAEAQPIVIAMAENAASSERADLSEVERPALHPHASFQTTRAEAAFLRSRSVKIPG